MQLRQLTRLSRIDIESELESIRENIKELESILADDKKLRGVIKDEIGSVRNDFELIESVQSPMTKAK